MLTTLPKVPSGRASLPRLGLVLALLAAAVGSSCIDPEPLPPDDDDDATFPDDDDDSSEDEPPCDPPLGLVPATASAPPLSLISFSGSGGTGDYRYVLEAAASGASIHPDLGIYIAGPTVGVSDEIRLEDRGCQGGATASVEVIEGLSVLPLSALLPPDPELEIAFEVSGGSGDWSCSLASGPSGGTLSPPCTYSAGASEGVDVVVIADEQTGQLVERWMTIAEDAGFEASAPRIAFPVGSEFTLDMQGGSGEIDVAPSTTEPGPIFEDGGFHADEVGAQLFTVTDHFTGQATEIEVESLPSQSAAFERMYTGSSLGHALAPGDVNGDGHADALLSWATASIDAHSGGAVYLWLGGPDGLSPTPARTWAGDGWDEQLGSQLGQGDLNDDGLLDLVIGSRRRTSAGLNVSGGVDIYFGSLDPEWPFEEEPSTSLAGDAVADFLGEGVAVCDFDGDGIDDLAAAGPGGDYGGGNNLVADVGTIHVHLGSPAGLSPEPDQVRWGWLPEEGESPGDWDWVLAEGQSPGRRLAAGDMDGDGHCDLVTTSYTYDGEGNNDGLVLLYMGSPDGIEEQPSRAWRGDGEELGRELALGDVDGDGRDDLLLGAARAEPLSSGAAYLFAGTEDIGQAEVGWTELSSASWLSQGDQSDARNDRYDSIGTWVGFGDYDGDGALDLWVSGGYAALANPPPGGLYDPGTVSIFAGATGNLPATEPTWQLEGEQNSDYFGSHVAALGDVDGDTLLDTLVVAREHGVYGVKVGAPFFVPGDDPLGASLLDFPGEAAGQHFGSSAAFVGDFDGDGFEDLVVGAPHEAIVRSFSSGPSVQRSAGAVYLYPGSGEGIAASPSLVLTDLEAANSWDRFGASISSAGDFTDDGLPDLAVLSIASERPELDPETYSNPADCGPSVGNDSGSVQVFAGYEGAAPDPFAPDFVWFGPDAQDGLTSVAGGDFDFNGDGISDLAVGQHLADTAAGSNAGAVHVLYGRARPAASGITLLCDPADSWSWDGVEAGAELGQSVAPLGDLDSDGCDDFAAGAPSSDLNSFANQGAIHLFFGAGPGCSQAEPRLLVLTPRHASNSAGHSLDGSLDVDGDGLRDLAVGGPNAPVDLDYVGTTWLLSSAYLGSLVPAQASSVASEEAIVTEPFGLVNEGIHVTGQVNQGRLGQSVALVPPFGVEGLAGLLAGAPLSNLAGPVLTGGARLHRIDPASPDELVQAGASLIFGGETPTIGGELGHWVAVGTVDGTVWAAIGGPKGDGMAVDTGSLYVVELGDAVD